MSATPPDHQPNSDCPLEGAGRKGGARRARSAGKRGWSWLPGFGGMAGLALWLIVGCATSGRPGKVALPAKHSLKTDQLLVLSDVRLSSDHPLIEDLKLLKEQVSETLELPIGSRQILVYLFESELTYRQYWQVTFPGYPMRRAYFVQTPDKQLAVYTFWGDRIQEDLRHEFTHGLLHASLSTVPLWLDEGLAEYFEVPGPTPGQVNSDYVDRMSIAIHNGWRPDLHRLEKLETVDQMQRTDYRESWAWIHFLLNSSPDTRQMLLQYIGGLRHNSTPGPLTDELLADVPGADTRLLSYIATLNSYSAPPARTAAKSPAGEVIPASAEGEP